jgi:hypothetical protein
MSWGAERGRSSSGSPPTSATASASSFVRSSAVISRARSRACAPSIAAPGTGTGDSCRPRRRSSGTSRRSWGPIFDPRGGVVAEADGRPVACAVAVPDINQVLKGTGGRLFPLGLLRLLRRTRIVDQTRLLLLGVTPEYRRPGLYPVLLHQLGRQLEGANYRRIGFS